MRGKHEPIDQRWESALAVFEQAQQASEYEDSTIARRIRHVRAFASEVDVPPFLLTWEAYRTRLDALPVSDSTRSAYRGSMRAFYHWAYRTNRVAENPTAEPSLRAQQLRASPAWEAELLPFVRHLRAIGRPETSVRTRLSQMRRFAREVPELQPFDVTQFDLLEFLATKPRWSAETRRSQTAALRSFYGWAKSADRTKKNPAKKLPAIREHHPVVLPASDEALREALAKAEAWQRLAIRVAAELGLRCGEVCRIHARDISGVDGDFWLLVHGKGSKQRRVPLADDLARLIRARGGSWAFPGNWDGHLSPGWMSKSINALLPPGVTMHKLRHRFASKAYAVDRDVFTLQQLLGHSSPATTQRYVHTTDSGKRRLVDAVRAGTTIREDT